MRQVECEISPLVSYCGEVSSAVSMCMSLFVFHCECVCHYLCPTLDVYVTICDPPWMCVVCVHTYACVCMHVHVCMCACVCM